MTPLLPLTLAPAAFLAGLLMFLAPCTLPLVPGYLAFISGSRASGNEQYKKSGRVVFNAIAFVLGFSFIFMLLGTFAGLAGSVLGAWRDTLGRVAGAIIILFGLTMLGLVRVPVLSQTKSFHIPHFLTLGRWESSLLIGMLFVLGWSPCIGPILGSILLIASTNGTAAQGALLLGVFSLGLGLPFLLTALLLNRIGDAFTRYSSALRVLDIIGGIVLLAIGALMLLGQMGLLISAGYGLFDSLHYSALLNYM
jgi:cytochrome c-type biogenesis protein